jgi:SAM-dependent methyltransferase
MASIERDHWWYRARREFISAAFARVGLPAGAKLLDAGCGTGGSLPMLSSFGAVHAFEYDAGAMAIASSQNVGNVSQGHLPDGIPFPGVQFDGIGLFDVLEHLERPVASLVALRDRMADDGAIVLTVPAYKWLWGPHDQIHNHITRYTASRLAQHLSEAGFRIEYLSYFNALLLPLAIVQRLRERLFGYSFEKLSPRPAINELLYRLWRVERHWIPRRELPFGLSLLAIARKADRSA